MAASHLEPLDRPRDFFAREVGLGHGVFRAMSVATVLSTATAIAAAGWALHTTWTAGDRVERYIVYVDSNAIPLRVSAAEADWHPDDGQFIAFAQQWVRFLRSRPRDESTLGYQRQWVGNSTDRSIYPQLLATMQAGDKQAGGSAVDVMSTSANVTEGSGNTRIVLVTWTEQVKSGSNPPATFTATLKIAYQKPRTSKEVSVNPVGLFVVSYQNTQQVAPK